MHDDETQISGMPNQRQNQEPDHRSGWTESDTVAGIRDHGDRPSSGSTPPGGWNSANGGWPGRAPYASGGPYGYQSGATAPAPAKKGGPGWLAPLVIVLAALVLVAGAFYFMRGRDDSSNTASPTVSGSSTTQSSPASASATTSNDPVAPLPAGTKSCVDPSGVINSSQAVIVKGPFSCNFANDVVSAIQSAVLQNSKTPSFTTGGVFSAVTGRTYYFNCNRQNHVSACTTNGKSGPLQIDVQDNISS